MSTWNPPDTSPKDGTILLLNIGWPWPVLGIWDPHREEWATAELAPAAPDESPGWETEHALKGELKAWQHLPIIPER